MNVNDRVLRFSIIHMKRSKFLNKYYKGANKNSTKLNINENANNPLLEKTGKHLI